MSSSEHPTHTNGAKVVSPTDFFESIGHKAEQLAPSSNGAAQIGDDDVKPVEEIESLCMNCHENVCPYRLRSSIYINSED